jgi:hypothetical protein
LEGAWLLYLADRAQQRVLDDLRHDLSAGRPMNRLRRAMSVRVRPRWQRWHLHDCPARSAGGS